MKKLLPALLTLLFAKTIAALPGDSTRYLLNFYYHLGAASCNSTPFGPAKTGLKMKAGGEYIFKSHFTLGIDMDYSFFFNVPNPELRAKTEANATSTGSTILTSIVSDDADIDFSTVSVSFSKLFFIGEKIRLQPKISVGRGRFAYDYTAVYTYSTSQSPGSFFSSVPMSTYLFSTSGFLSVKPELNASYLFRSGRISDLSFNGGINAFYAPIKSTMYRTEENFTGNSSRSEVLTVNGNFLVVGGYVGLVVTLKKINS